MKNRPRLRFALQFGAIASLLFTIYAFPYSPLSAATAWFDGYLAGYASLVAWVLGLFEPNVAARGATIVGRASLQIVKSCDAMEAKLLLASAILAFPGALWRKALATVGGLIALAAVNVLRISSLYFVVAAGSDLFDFLHLEVWPLLMIVAASGLFLLATRFVQTPVLNSEPTHANGRS